MRLSCQEGIVPGASFAEKLRHLEHYGFDGVELNGDRLNDPEGFLERKRALADSPLRASSICGGYPLEIVHPDPARRRTSLDGIRRHLDFAAELGAAGPIVVPIFNGNDRVPDLSPYRTRQELERELLLAVLAPLAEHACACGVAVLLEPLNRYESNCLPRQRDGAAVVRGLGSPGVRLMSDVFHMHIEEPDLPAAVRECGDVIAHVHLADSTRLEPGSGCTDFAAILDALREVGFTGFLAMECGLSGPAEVVLPQSVSFLRHLMA